LTDNNISRFLRKSCMSFVLTACSRIMGVNHRGQGASPLEFKVGVANANFPPEFQKYRSEFTKTQFQAKKSFFWGGVGPPQTPFPVDRTPLPQPSLLDLPLRPPRNESQIYVYVSCE